jgi:hypothetical protein
MTVRLAGCNAQLVPVLRNALAARVLRGFVVNLRSGWNIFSAEFADLKFV